MCPAEGGDQAAGFGFCRIPLGVLKPRDPLDEEVEERRCVEVDADVDVGRALGAVPEVDDGPATTELGLELDDGLEVTLGPGDVVVQNGTRHRWHNRGEVVARLLSVTIGARHEIRGGRAV